MPGKFVSKRLQNLEYLSNRPEKVYWEVIAPKGYKLSILQEYDLVFDDYDRKIRQLSI